MKASIFVILAILVLFVSCGKSGASKPQITIKSITTLIPFGSNFDAILKFTDKQGDLAGGTFVAIINPVNLDTNGRFPVITSITDTIPDFPKYTSGEFDFTLTPTTFQKQTFRNDSLIMKFVVIDKANNVSDTITTPLIVALYQ